MVPVAGTVYGTTKKVLAGFGDSGAQRAFQRFVLARLPGRTTPGFLMSTFTLHRADGAQQALATVYVPVVYGQIVDALAPKDNTALLAIPLALVVAYGGLRVVNLEVDVIAKYVEKLIGVRA